MTARRWRAATALVVALAATVGGSLLPTSAAADTAPAPGLPLFHQVQTQLPLGEKNPNKVTDIQFGTTDSALVAGAVDAGRPKLAVSLPISLVDVDQVSHQRYQVPSPVKKIKHFQTVLNYVNLVYVHSPAGTDPPYGVLPPLTATTLAFGMVPVRTTVSLAQPRENRTAAEPLGTPVPLVVNVYEDTSACGGVCPNDTKYDVTMTGQLLLTLRDVLVDGKPLDVGSACTTTTPVTVSVVSKFGQPDPTRPPGFYSPIFGGDLYGTLAIPPFTGCRGAGGEDLSPLFTNALSGPSNAVHLNQGALGQGFLGCTPQPVLACQRPSPVSSQPGQVPSQPPSWTPNLPPAPLPLLPHADAPAP
ncbi:hypothetical protein FB458_0504 [Lapillicoccus jejuensis]|uniref:Secreted protein n=1 Tax=Lapillicoccus jejuensis TaxID=402171 RepID=A0A542DWG9_9MICO|nr:hypothetical protein FB458_0504 [Lapillicoccus jejuensis]